MVYGVREGVVSPIGLFLFFLGGGSVGGAIG